MAAKKKVTKKKKVVTGGKKFNQTNPKSLANLVSWKPGKSGNPNGLKKLTDLERQARDASRHEIAGIYQALKGLTTEQLKILIKDTTTPAITVLFATSFLKGMQKGDLSEVHRMYDRLLGKPKQVSEITGADGGPIQVDTAKYETRAKEIIANRIRET